MTCRERYREREKGRQKSELFVKEFSNETVLPGIFRRGADYSDVGTKIRIAKY